MVQKNSNLLSPKQATRAGGNASLLSDSLIGFKEALNISFNKNKTRNPGFSSCCLILQFKNIRNCVRLVCVFVASHQNPLTLDCCFKAEFSHCAGEAVMVDDAQIKTRQHEDDQLTNLPVSTGCHPSWDETASLSLDFIIPAL